MSPSTEILSLAWLNFIPCKKRRLEISKRLAVVIEHNYSLSTTMNQIVFRFILEQEIFRMGVAFGSLLLGNQLIRITQLTHSDVSKNKIS